jgi:mono/diheme cytochrome c family protein
MSRVGVAVAASLLVAACSRSDAAPQPNARDLFLATCARCHGAEGTGGLPLWEGGPSPRNFRDHAFHAERTDAQLRETIKTGKGTGMPAFGAALTDAQITSLVAYVRSLDPQGGR